MFWSEKNHRVFTEQSSLLSGILFNWLLVLIVGLLPRHFVVGGMEVGGCMSISDRAELILIVVSPQQMNVNAPLITDQALLHSHRRETVLQATYNLFTTDLTSDILASLTADVILYPLETIVVRLCVQGTRTLVDNLDTGDSVIPIISSFDGFFDVLRSAASSASGFVGLYRGFGALVLQYTVQLAFLFGVKYTFDHLLCSYYYATQTSAAQPPSSMTRRSSVAPGDYDSSNKEQASFSSAPFYSSATRQFEPMTSVWQPTLDSDKWRSSDSVLNAEKNARSSTSAFAFRGYNPGPYDAPL